MSDYVIPHRREAALRPLTLWRQLGRSWQLAIWLLITLRVGLGLLGIAALQLLPITGVGGDWLNLVSSGSDVPTRMVSVWQRWDALWYQHIAEHGYRAGNGTTAFFPLYPLLTRVASFPLGGHTVLAQLLVSSAAFVVAMWLLYRVARLDAGPIASRVAVLMPAFFPVGFFLLAPYTESLYLALTLAAFLFARQGRPWQAGVAGLCAGLTRAQGAFLVLPLAFEYLRRRDERSERPDFSLLSATLPPLGLIAVAAFDRVVVGERRSVLGVQSWWGYHLSPPWQTLQASWHHIVTSGDVIEVINLVCLVGFTLLAIWLTRRLPLLYALYVWPYLALLYARQMYVSPLMSVSRFTVVLFPCFVVLAIWLARRPWLAAGSLLASLMLQTLLFVYWVHFGFVA